VGSVESSAGSGAFAAVSSLSDHGLQDKSLSLAHSIVTPHMSMSLSISHAMGKTGGGPGGVVVGHALTRDMAKALSTPGRTTADATSVSDARVVGTPNATGSVSLGTNGGATAVVPATGLSATANTDATTSLAAPAGATAPITR
jgi:hypothetical protein